MAIAHEKRKYTYDDYAKLPEGERVELIGGEFLLSPAPRTRHQLLLGKIYMALSLWLKSHPAGQVFLAPTDVVLSPHDVVQPDILFISEERLSIITEPNIQGAPDLAVEILSPTDEKRDTIIKKALYEKHRVREYWVVDPDARKISVYILESEKFVLRKIYAEGETLESPLLSDFRFPLSELFTS